MEEAGLVEENLALITEDEGVVLGRRLRGGRVDFESFPGLLE